MAVQNEAGANCLINNPIGMKYMLAMECSNPAATKAVMGGMMARMRSVVVRALKVSQTARQTRALHKIPNAIACTKSRPDLALAVDRAAAPTTPFPKAYWPVT